MCNFEVKENNRIVCKDLIDTSRAVLKTQDNMRKEGMQDVACSVFITHDRAIVATILSNAEGWGFITEDNYSKIFQLIHDTLQVKDEMEADYLLNK